MAKGEKNKIKKMCLFFYAFFFLQCSRSVVSDSLRPHGLQHARPPYPSTLEVYSNSCPLSWWCHPTISSFVTPFSCPQSFPALGSSLVRWLFASGSQSIGASASVLSMNILGWFPLGLTGLVSFQSKGLSRIFSSTSLKASILQHLAFFMVQFSHLYMTTGKTIALTMSDLCQQSDVSAKKHIKKYTV